MRKTFEKIFCDCCGKEFDPIRSEFLPCSENKYKRAEVRFLIPVLTEPENENDVHTRYDTFEINDICDECLDKLVDFTEVFLQADD